MASKSKKIQKVIDGIRAWNLSSSSSSTRSEIEETLKSDNFKFGNIVQYGFPNGPTCIAYEPVQKLLVIGTKSGSGRIFGRPGVDHEFRHPSNCSIIQIIFIINQGVFLSICDDDTVHQWNYQTKPVELVHSLQFKRERSTCAYLSLGSSWMYIGTEKGNVLFVNVQKFVISGYVINWNKAIALSQSSHPGSVVQLADNPLDSNKLLIGFSTGFLSLWNLKEKAAKFRFKFNEILCGFCWYPDGKNFITCHHGGFLVTWNSRQSQAPLTVIQPHNRDIHTDSKIGFEPIKKIVLLTTKSEESIMVFSGGTPKVPSQNAESTEISGSFPSVTVMKDKRLIILQMDYPVIDFAQLCDSCSQNCFTDPVGIAILLQNDLMVIDLLSPNYPSFENPYPIDLHVSPVTCLYYISDCPGDFVASLYTAKSRTKKSTHTKNQNSTSNHEWPINGGQWGSLLNPHSEMIITGHADGSIRFWEATGTSLTSLHKFRLSTYLEKMVPCTDSSHIIDCNKSDSTQSTPTLSGNNTGTNTNISTLVDDCGRPCGLEHSLMNANVTPLNDENPVAINHIQLCPDSRKLMLAGKYFATMLSFTKRDVISDVPVLDNVVVYEVQEEAELATEDFGMNKQTALPHQSLSLTSCQDKQDFRVFIGVKSGLIKWCPGYQPDLVCRLGSYTASPPSIISAISFNANLGIMAFGNDQGIIVVDFVQKISLLSSGTPDLYGSNDPYTRVSWSPNSKKDDLKSPVSEVQTSANGNVTSNTSTTSPGANDPSTDLNSSKSSSKNAGVSKTELKRAKSQETAHFSRSCSSSTSSLENINCETIRSLAFAETYSRKGDSGPKPCLWIGTNLGSIIVVNLNVPDLRTTQPVIVSPSGTIYRLRGSILSISFLDSNGDILGNKISNSTTIPDTKLPSSNSYGSNSSINNNQKDTGNPSTTSPTPMTSKKLNYVSKQSTVSSSSSSFGFGGTSNSAATFQNDNNADTMNDCQFAVLCSEKNAQVIALPSQSQLYNIKITETSVVLKATVITVKSSPCLVTFVANGHLMAFSLPSLRLLMDLDNVLDENCIENVLCIANHGLFVYMSSISEMDKASFSAELTNNIKNAQGDLYIQREMPSPPKKGFFENLFNNTIPVDFDELFGEASSGKASTASKTLLQPSKMESVQQKAANSQSEIAKARMAALERGEKLSEAELKTQEMLDHAKMYSKTASLLVAKYEKKDKRWGLPF